MSDNKYIEYLILIIMTVEHLILIMMTVEISGSVFTNHSQEHCSSLSPRCCKLECNTASDWLNGVV